MIQSTEICVLTAHFPLAAESKGFGLKLAVFFCREFPLGDFPSVEFCVTILIHDVQMYSVLQLWAKLSSSSDFADPENFQNIWKWEDVISESFITPKRTSWRVIVVMDTTWTGSGVYLLDGNSGGIVEVHSSGGRVCHQDNYESCTPINLTFMKVWQEESQYWKKARRSSICSLLQVLAQPNNLTTPNRQIKT